MRLPLVRFLAEGVFASSLAGRAIASVAGARGAIFFLHRFDCFPGQEAGHRVEELRAILDAVRRVDIDIVSVDEAVRVAIGQSPARRSRPFVAFSVDDCYWDFTSICLPVFLEFDAPVTGFVCPGLVEQNDWFWWDKLWYLASRARRSVTLEISGITFHVPPLSSAEGTEALNRLREGLKAISHDQRTHAVQQLALALDIELPAAPPDEFTLASFDALRAAESPLVQFGAHTMTHPVLATCSDTEARWQIEESISRVRAAFVQPSRVFCYPNGTQADFGPREMRILDGCDVAGAITTLSGALLPGSHTGQRHAVPRFTIGKEPAFAVRRILFGR
ncbi:polysaccharide deacetylase family protein [Gemmatimonas sp.]|jgi:peptidoglycan/xylan/chitin deacetylase (PgdA/CDA1 family)|uniref:polysaccharide deacetylase family protein n=1 Tax=Gemmatimonas sp. TaxID=1962908 RepID=UPI0037C19EED